MHLFTFVACFFILLFFSSCCTKKHCANIEFPQLEVKLSGFSEVEAADKCLYTYSKTSRALIDSVNFRHYDFSPINLTNPVNEFYVVRVSQSRDTIHNISYHQYQETIKCNTCFPAGNGDATVTRFRDLRYDLNGTTFYGSEEIFIRRE
jgi:hypothetical protein